MSVFRNVIFNFKSEEDCENFLTRYKIFIEQDEKIGLETFYICRLTKDSLLIFAMIDTEENAKKLLQSGADVLVAGSYVFRSNDPKDSISMLKNL